MHSATLTCHQHSRTEAVRRATVRVCRVADGKLTVAFALDGDLHRLRIPPPQPREMADGLWQHTCFEVFIALERAPAYHEFNFAPSGQWAVYAFRGYRDREPVRPQGLAPDLTLHRAADRLELEAVVRLGGLSARHTRAALRLALSAVIEEDGGALSYWALRHPVGKPDFHHAEAFALLLDAPGMDSTRDPG
jgi:hypothetical protein